MKSSAKIQIVFDDRCGFCQRSRRIFQALDPFHVCEWLPLSHHPDFFDGLSDTANDPQREMHGLYRGQVYKGYALYTLMCRVNPLLRVFYPLALLGWWTGLGNLLYRFIAAQRQAISRVCRLNPDIETSQG
ncbi:MAG: thiol-disulfide oxidoreductase DCC family protein [Candidatus Melainabacteria bacterium]